MHFALEIGPLMFLQRYNEMSSTNAATDIKALISEPVD